MHPLASRRIIRLAFGTSLALFIAQAVNWSVSFIAPALVAFLLALPLPGLKLKQAVVFVLALAIPVWGATWMLLPLLSHQQLVGLLLLIPACFWAFYYSSSGGSPVLGAFLTMGLAIVTAVGSDSINAALAVNYAVTVNAVIAMALLWLAFFLFPDPPAAQAMPKRPPAPKPDRKVAIRSAWRSTVIVLPVIVFFLAYQGSASYLVVMIKVASMGQQAENDLTRSAGKSLLMSTVIGGAGAIIMWNLLKIWPSLIFYCLLMSLGGLIMGRRIFRGAGMHPSAGTWSYAFLTMLVLIAPSVLDGPGGDAAGAKFFDRLSMMAWATVYAVAAVTVFDAFWHSKAPRRIVE